MPDIYNKVNERSLRPLLGRRVCVVMKDDTHYIGILSSCGPSALILNGERSQRPGRFKNSVHVNSSEASSAGNEQQHSSDFWGPLSIAPLNPRNPSRITIPFTPVKEVFKL